MIDGVEFDVVDQLEQMRKFDRHGTPGLEEQREAGDEVIQQRHVREHVVADDQIGPAALAGELPRQVSPKNSTSVGTPISLRVGRHRIGRVDAEHRYAHRDEVLEQVAVVARNLDHQTVRIEREAAARHFAVLGRMRQPIIGVGREVDVVAEQLLRRHVIVQLHEFAALAHLRTQRIALLVARRVHRLEKCVRGRLHPQIGHRHREPAAARAAARNGAYHRCAVIATVSTEPRRCPTVR